MFLLFGEFHVALDSTWKGALRDCFLLLLFMKEMRKFSILVSWCLLVANVIYAQNSQETEGEKNEIIIGIDLGTTHSRVGIFKDGQVEIIPNEFGNRMTPSYVAFTTQERLVGEAAQNQAILNPKNTLFDIKRLIGRNYSDSTVQIEKEFLPFEIVNQTNKPYVSVEYQGERKLFSPEEMTSMILAKMKNTAETYLGKTVQNAIVTVPAYFNDAQRQATINAGKIAGLSILRVINEPTAAAFAYGVDLEGEDEKNIMVFDLGGGSLDVSILACDMGVVEVLGTGGDTHLGGEDFDRRTMRYLLNKFEEETGLDCSKDKRAIQKLRQEAEWAKRALSEQPLFRVQIGGFCQGIDFSHTLTRAKFEEINADLFEKTIEVMERTFNDTMMHAFDIDEVLLVGGSSYIPKIRQLVKDFFDGKEPNNKVDPDEASVYGAAIQAGVLMNDDGSQGLIAIEFYPLTLGIETLGGVMTPIIPRGTWIPTRKSLVFSTSKDNQDTVLIQVYEGERSMTKDNRLVGKFTLSGIEPAPRGTPMIEVTFEIDENGILDVHAVDQFSGNAMSFVSVTEDKGGLSDEEIERMIEEAIEAQKEDKIIKETVDARNKFENYLYFIENSLAESEKRGGVGPKEREIAGWILADARGWLALNGYTASKEQIEWKYDLLDDIIRATFSGLPPKDGKGGGGELGVDDCEF